MPSSLSGPIFRTTLTSQHASWNKFSRTLHIPNNDTVDEIQLKARMQQRHHRVYPDIDNFTVVSFRGKEYSVRFIKDGETDNYVYKVQKMTTENGCFSRLFSFLSGGVTKALERRLNERQQKPLTSTWFPRTPLEGILMERGLSSLLLRVQSTERLDYPGATTSTPFSNAVV